MSLVDRALRLLPPWSQRIGWRGFPTLLIVSHALLGFVYAWVTPVWEGYDEPSHFSFVRRVAEEKTLPSSTGSLGPSSLGWQYSQPPLYYIAVSPVIMWMDLPPEEPPPFNHFGMAFGDPERGVNLFLPTPPGDPELQMVHLALRLVRMASTLVGTLAVGVTYLLAITIFPRDKRLALTALAIFAFAPQPLFIGSVVNNDIGIIALSSATLWLACRAAIRRSPLSLSGAFVLSILAMFTKFNGVALIPVVLASAIVLALNRPLPRRGWPKIRQYLTAGGVAFLVLGLFLLAWFGAGLGELFRERYSVVADQFVIAAGALLSPSPGLPRVSDYLGGVFLSFWSAFGWGNVLADRWAYIFFLGVSALAILGPVLWIKREQGVRRVAGLLVTAYLISFLGVLGLRLAGGSFLLGGRYLLPAMPAVALLASYTLSAVFHQRARRLALGSLALAFAGLGILVPFLYIRPAYARPASTSIQEATLAAQPVRARFGGAIELLGYETRSDSAQPGSEVLLSLYFRSLSPLDENYVMSIQALGPDLEIYAMRNTHPGHGNYPTSLWQPGENFKDTYRLSLSPEFPAPGYVQFKVSFSDLDAGEHLPVRDGQGVYIGNQVLFGQLPIRRTDPLQIPPQSTRVLFKTGDFASLVAYRLEERRPADESLKLYLYWQAHGTPSHDYTVFVHLLDASGDIIAQADAQPRKNSYPTSLWDPGEIVEDFHRLPLSAERSRSRLVVGVGMYLLETLERLPVLDEEGELVPDDVILLPLPVTE